MHRLAVLIVTLVACAALAAPAAAQTPCDPMSQGAIRKNEILGNEVGHPGADAPRPPLLPAIAFRAP